MNPDHYITREPIDEDCALCGGPGEIECVAWDGSPKTVACPACMQQEHEADVARLEAAIASRPPVTAPAKGEDERQLEIERDTWQHRALFEQRFTEEMRTALANLLTEIRKGPAAMAIDDNVMVAAEYALHGRVAVAALSAPQQQQQPAGGEDEQAAVVHFGDGRVKMTAGDWHGTPALLMETGEWGAVVGEVRPPPEDHKHWTKRGDVVLTFKNRESIEALRTSLNDVATDPAIPGAPHADAGGKVSDFDPVAMAMRNTLLAAKLATAQARVDELTNWITADCGNPSAASALVHSYWEKAEKLRKENDHLGREVARLSALASAAPRGGEGE